MSKKFKWWLAMLISLGLAIAALAIFNPIYAKGILLSLFRGEIAMIYWIARAGLSQAESLVITILISTASITHYFWLGGQASEPFGKFMRKHRPTMRKALSINAKRPRQEPNSTPDGKFKKLARKFPYFILPLYNFDFFFGVPTGIVFAKSSKLNMTAAFAIMCAGNVFEKTAWSYLIKSAQPVIGGVVTPIIFLTLGIVLTYSLLSFLQEPDKLS